VITFWTIYTVPNLLQKFLLYTTENIIPNCCAEFGCSITSGGFSHNAYNMQQYDSNDVTAVGITYQHYRRTSTMFVASVCPGKSTSSAKWRNFSDTLKRNIIPTIIGSDTNSHHYAWGIKTVIKEDLIFVNIIATTNL